MVYCNLIKTRNDEVVYAIGGTTKDITGELVINYKDKSYRLTKQPEESKVYDRHISSMVYRAMSRFIRGEFPQRLSYEI